MSGDLITIAKSSKHKQESYEFMRWLTTEGIVDQGIFTPAWKEADMNKSLETVVNGTKKPDAIHMESLKNALTSVKPIEVIAPPLILMKHGANLVQR